AAGLGLLIDSTNRANDKLGVLESTIGGALTGAAVGGAPGADVGALAGGLFGAFQMLNEASSDATDAQREYAKSVQRSKERNEALKASLDDVTGAITRQTRVAMARAIQEDRDMRIIMDELGLSLGVMTQAALGNEKAMQ